MGNYHVRFRGRGVGYPTGSLRPYPTASRISKRSLSATPNTPPHGSRHEAAPALTRFANSSPMPFVNGIRAARERGSSRARMMSAPNSCASVVSGKSETAKIIEVVLAEEGRKPESVFDFVQGITAVARDKPHQDARLDLEARAKKLLDRVA